MGMYAMGIPAGLVIDRFGVRLGVFLGAVFLGCGYFPMKYGIIMNQNSGTLTMTLTLCSVRWWKRLLECMGS